MSNPIPIFERRLLTIQEVAEILSVGERTVRRWIAEGELDALRVGPRNVRIPVASVERLVGARPIRQIIHA